RRGEKADETEIGKQRTDGERAGDIAPAFRKFVHDVTAGFLQLDVCEAHHEQADDDADVADAVYQEAVAFAHAGDEDAGDGRSDEARGVDHGGVDGDGVAEVFALFHHLQHEGLACGQFERVDHALHEREHNDFPHGDDAGKGQACQGERLQHGNGLQDDDGAVPVPAVDPHAGD